MSSMLALLLFYFLLHFPSRPLYWYHRQCSTATQYSSPTETNNAHTCANKKDSTLGSCIIQLNWAHVERATRAANDYDSRLRVRSCWWTQPILPQQKENKNRIQVINTFLLYDFYIFVWHERVLNTGTHTRSRTIHHHTFASVSVLSSYTFSRLII